MRALVLILMSLMLPSAMAAELRDLRVWDGPESTRVVFDLSDAPDYRLFTLSDPDRVVIDIANLGKSGGKSSAAVVSHAQAKGLVSKLRAGPQADGSLRVVMDVSESVMPKGFALEPNAQYGNRLIVELYGHTPTLEEISTPDPLPPPSHPAVDNTPRLEPVLAEPPAAAAIVPVPAPAHGKDNMKLAPSLGFAEKPIVIAVDAGHGGEDPGAMGRGGLREKDATLAMARRLANLINEQPGMKAVLTRDGDYFVELRERTIKAREAQADMFVSIHCNAYKDRSLRGSAVYVLSDHGASSEQARWLARTENSADMVGGLDLGTKDKELAAVLIDLSQASSMEASFDAGGRVLKALSRVNTLEKPVVQQAGFMVLKSPDIPSMLVETAFISNDQDERLLGQAGYQDQIARSVLEGIQGYFKSYRPHPQQTAEEQPHLQKVRATAHKSHAQALASD